MTGEVESPEDGALTDAVRAGDGEAFSTLYARHRPRAEQVARSLVPAADVGDVVAEAFLAVYVRLRAGGGPTDDVGAYLRRVVVNESIDRHRRAGRVSADDDVDDRRDPEPDPADPWFESRTIARAYRSLPDRWRRVLWQVEVEGRAVGEVAHVEGVSAARLSAVAYRARRGLRVAYLTECLGVTQEPGCRDVRRLLPDDVRGVATRRQRERIERHLRECGQCQEARAELVRLDQQLDGWLFPAAAGAGAGGVGLAVAGGVSAGFVGFVTLPLVGAVTAVIVAGGLLAGSAERSPDVSRGTNHDTPPAALSESRRPAVAGPDGSAPEQRVPAPAPSPDAEAVPVDETERLDEPDWTERPPSVGDRVLIGGRDVMVVERVEHTTETERGEERELAPQADAPGGSTVWEREYDEVTVERTMVVLVVEDEVERWEDVCDGSVRERQAVGYLEEFITIRHREGYRIEVDGTRTPVSESEEIDRWSGVRMLPGNPVVECAVTDPEEASEGVA
ncbi:sigma-70 family RNA polymerase sigma factor [Aeromicrobium piscarium]|uniref:sigma-70 family RNA polymerase sigma factor n=1 Tax=Aeromicrobium piscarium TaxID=2590901 RepID=UPI00163D8C42|nr:sigma-70 family RNA polymerase sigma factor [Aeromicrobium piscarium]